MRNRGRETPLDGLARASGKQEGVSREAAAAVEAPLPEQHRGGAQGRRGGRSRGRHLALSLSLTLQSLPYSLPSLLLGG